MTPDRQENEPVEAENGVLASSVDTTAIGIGNPATAQVDVTLPALADADDDFDEDVVAGDHVELDEVVVEPEPVAPASRPFTQPSSPTGTGSSASARPPAAAAGSPARFGSAAGGASASTVASAGSPAGAHAGSKAVATAGSKAVAETEDHHERIRPRTSEVTLQSRRLGDFEPSRETSDLLTPDRLLDPAHVVRSEPEGPWQHFVYTVSGRRINLGDSKRARARKALDRRISGPLTGGAKFVPVLSRKGGVGKTTVTTLLGMALADARDDRVIAVDANPDRGTLAERVGRSSGHTVRDLVRDSADVHGFNDISQIVARDETRLDVLASDTDPHVSEAFNDEDYQKVSDIAAHFYSIVLTDTGTGIVHSVMEATLERADQLVIVAGLSVDEARLASETLTWLETNGFAEQVRHAVVVLNTARPGAALVRASELEAHFNTRVRAVVRVPYDPQIAAGSAIAFRDLQPETRLAARELAATVVEGLRTLGATV